MPRWAIALAVVVALVPAGFVTAQRVLDDDTGSPGSSATDLPIPPVSPSTQTGTPTGTPTGTATTPAAPPLPSVAPDVPRRLTSDGVVDTGFDSAVTGLDASSDAEVARWEPRGLPGSPGTDTVYVIGRARADHDSAFAHLARLRSGSEISIRTDIGTLTYRVTATRLVPESGLAGGALFRRHHPGRLVLVGIRYDGSGDRLDRAIVVTAQLSAATRSATGDR